jgi:hypothetical protein
VPPDQIADMHRVRVWRMPDNYRNVTIGCDGPNLVYVTSAGSETDSKVGSSVFVVPGDPYCTGNNR